MEELSHLILLFIGNIARLSTNHENALCLLQLVNLFFPFCSCSLMAKTFNASNFRKFLHRERRAVPLHWHINMHRTCLSVMIKFQQRLIH